MLREAIQIIRELLGGDLVDWKGEYFEIDSARVWDIPRFRLPSPRRCLASGPLKPFAPLADHLIAIEPNKDVVDAWHDARRATGLPGDVRVIGQIPVCWDPDRDTAVKRAHEQFRWFAGGWAVNRDLPTTAGFAGATQFVRPEDVAESIRAARISTRSSRRSASTGTRVSPISRWCRSVTKAKTCSSRRPPDRCWKSCGQLRSSHTKGIAMPRGKGLHDDENPDEPKGGRPGPTDQRREGGMATRENAPDLTTSESTQEPPD